MRKLFKIAIVVLVVIVILIVSLLAVLLLDLTSYSATGSETLSPVGTNAGRAMVVYDPGFSGSAKQDASKIAGDLQAKGYTTILAGVRSGSAGNVSGYDIIVAGGPLYWGKVTSSIDGFLKTVPNSAKLGVFASTGSSSYSASDFASLQEQVTSDTQNGRSVVRLILDGNETNNCADLVNTLIQLS